MFSKIWTKTSIPDFSAQIERLKTAIAEADAVVIGAGAGLSTAAGFAYSGERFERYFSDFAEKYGIRDMYSGGFYPFPTSEEFWAYWSRYIFVNRYMDAPKPVYNDLLKLVANKDYFVITTNVDHCFQKAGFDKKRLFYTQGTMVSSNAASRAARRPLITRLSSARWQSGRRRCAFPRNCCPDAPIAAAP